MAGRLTADARDEMAIPSYLHPNPLMRWMAWRRVELLARHLGRMCLQHGSISSSSPMILDFGCGTGVMLGEASQHAQRVYASDLFVDAAKILVNAWKLDNVTLVAADDVSRTILESSLDIIIAGEVLEHLDDLNQTLSFFRNRLQPQGRLLISVPTEGALYRCGRRMAGFHGHYHVANAASIHNDILNAGFKTESLEKTPGPGPFAIYWIVEYSVPQ